MKRDHGAAAEGFLDLFGFTDFDSGAYPRAKAAAIYFSECLHELRLIRQLLTPKK